MAPTIGITFTSPNIRSNADYIHAIKKFGGIPYPLYPGVLQDNSANIRGLLLTGGPDIDPRHYNEKKHRKTQTPCRSRDELECSLFKWSMEENLPVFGICRGIQIMSVAMGGSLFQDIPCQFTDPLCHGKKHETKEDSEHKIEIETNSLLIDLIGKNIDVVNSAHHQAVKETGRGFIVTAKSADGVIEAIENENPSKWFLLGVQYHPERMLKNPNLEKHAAKLFTAFIEAASKQQPRFIKKRCRLRHQQK